MKIPVLTLATLMACGTVCAADTEYGLTIRDHKFEPAELKVPAGQKFVLQVKNADKTPEEFESHALKREKVIVAGGSATIKLGPLKPGVYPFFGEFHEKTAQGKLIVE